MTDNQIEELQTAILALLECANADRTEAAYDLAVMIARMTDRATSTDADRCGK